MRIRIDRERDDRTIPNGWFGRTSIAAYSLSLVVTLSEEEKFLLRHSGIGHTIFFRAPLPPDVVDLAKIKKLKDENFGLFFARDIGRFGVKTLIGVWPDVIAADEAEVAIRLKLEEIAAQLSRAGETTECVVTHEL